VAKKPVSRGGETTVSRQLSILPKIRKRIKKGEKHRDPQLTKGEQAKDRGESLQPRFPVLAGKTDRNQKEIKVKLIVFPGSMTRNCGGGEYLRRTTQ